MPVFYLETSALLKKYQEEKGTPVIQQLFAEKKDSELFITSYFSAVEVVSVMTRLARARTITQRTYRNLLGSFSRDARELILLQPVSDRVLVEAVSLASEYALRAPDAIHLSTALGQRSVSQNEPFYFFCSDKRLVEAGIASGVDVLDPEDANALEALNRYRASP